jgi:hypothetical protein
MKRAIIIEQVIETPNGYDIGLSGRPPKVRRPPKVIFVPEKFDFLTISRRGERIIVLDESLYVLSGTKINDGLYGSYINKTAHCRYCGREFRMKSYRHVYCSRWCKQKYGEL